MKKIAVFSYLYFEDLFRESLGYISNTPAECDIYIATDTPEKIDNIESLCAEILPDHTVNIMLHGGNGRDIAALLVLFKEYCLKYDLFCFIHDKKSSQMKYESVGRDFNTHMWKSLLGCHQLVDGIISRFSEEKHLGLMVPSLVTHGEYFHTMIDGWTICYDGTVHLAKDLGLSVPIHGDKNPLSLGSAFWARTSSLQKLFDYPFTYDTFPGEPFPYDGSISHCIERIFPYVALDAGFYTGVVYPRDIAENTLLNQSHTINSILKRLDSIKLMDTASLKSTLKSLDSSAFARKAIDPVFIDDRLADKADSLLMEFNETHDPFKTYQRIRDELVISCIYPKSRILRSFCYKIKKEIRKEIYLYRYDRADIILDAIEDYLEGPSYLESMYHEYRIAGAKVLFDIDGSWYRQCEMIDDCDTVHMLVRVLSFNGYLLKPNRTIVIPIEGNKSVQGYRATEITFFDEVTACGYVRMKNVSEAVRVHNRYRYIIHQLRRDYRCIASEYREAYPNLSTEGLWKGKLRDIDEKHQNEHK